jgi:membrane-bound serine protease (ClpP class)
MRAGLVRLPAHMRRVALPFALLAPALLVSGLVAGTAAAQAPAPTPIEVLKIEGPLDRPLLAFLEDRLDAAAEEGAVVVLQLDSPGTLDQDGVALAEKVVAMPVPVLVWVGPVPAAASGAGLLLMHASSLAAVAPGSQTGPLTPVDVGDPDRTYPDLDQRIASWVEARAKTTDLSYPDRALTAQEALELGLAQETAGSALDLLRIVDGTEVQTAAGPVVLRTRVATTEAEAEEGSVALRFNEPGLLKRVQHAVATPSMVYWLLVAALAALAFELTQPGFGFAGFAGLFLLAFGLYGLTVVPPAWGWFAVFLAGQTLLILDVRLRKLGPLTAAGLVLFAVGSWYSWAQVADAIRISPWLIGGAVVAALLYYGFALTVAIQSRDRILHTQRGLIGMVGEARGKLAPDGPVYVKGALWRGRAQGDEIAQGATVRVRGVDGLILKVEEEPASDEGLEAEIGS